ncbi:MAG: flippase [Methanosarcinaceae archaeon]|nr:flippase [Methanosarcinaceae archaeon]
MFKKKILLSRIVNIEPVRRQSIISFLRQIGFTIIGFLSTMYFAHEVGASVLGAYYLFLAYYGIINMITDGGFGTAAIKRISEGEEQDAYFSAFFVVRSLFVIMTIIFLLLLREYFTDLNEMGIFNWLLLVLIVSVFAGAINSGVSGLGKIGIHETCVFINNIFRILTQVVAIYFGFEVAGLVGGFVLGALVATIVEFRFFDLKLVPFTFRHVKSLSSFSFWFFLTSSGVMVYSYADTVMIGYFMSNADIGVYRVLFQFSSFAMLTTSAISCSLWPKISRWGKIKDFKLVQEALSKAFTYSLVLAIPISVGGLLLGDKLLYFLYGPEFAKGYYTLLILLCVQLMNIFQYFFGSFLSALDKVKDSFKATATAAVANIVFNFTLIPLIGISGAAIATLLTIGINSLLAQRALSTVIVIRVNHYSLFNIAKASLLMVLFVLSYRLLVPLNNVYLTLVPVVFGCFIYCTSLLILDHEINFELKKIAVNMGIKVFDRPELDS